MENRPSEEIDFEPVLTYNGEHFRKLNYLDDLPFPESLWISGWFNPCAIISHETEYSVFAKPLVSISSGKVVRFWVVVFHDCDSDSVTFRHCYQAWEYVRNYLFNKSLLGKVE